MLLQLGAITLQFLTVDKKAKNKGTKIGTEKITTKNGNTKEKRTTRISG